jgi:hypothetical protein
LASLLTSGCGRSGLYDCWLVTLDEVEMTTAWSAREDFERLRTRALSTFEHLSEDAIEEGLAAIEAALPAMDDQPVATPGDLLVFER